MINETVTIDLGDEWIPLPASSDLDVLRETVSAWDVAEETRREVWPHLAQAMWTAAQLPAEGDRASYAFVPEPASARVEALLSVRVARVGADEYAAYLATLRTDQSTEESIVWNRHVREAQLALGPAVVMHDVSFSPDDSGLRRPAVERAIVALFPDGTDVLIEATLMTMNLAYFDDIAVFLVDLVENRKAIQ